MSKKHWWDDWGSSSFDDDYDPYAYWYKSSGKKKESKYKSSLGYSSGSLTSATTSSWYSGSYGSSWTYSKGTSEGEFEKNRQLLSRAYKTARDMIIILDFPFKITVQFGKTEVFLKPGERRIYVPTKIFDDDTRDETNKINTFCGLGSHEAAHLKYTSYKVISDIEKLESTAISPYMDSASLKDFFDVLFNIIEDERVEDRLLTERPGYVDFIKLSKEYKYEGLKHIDSSGAASEAERFLIELIKLIRFPDHLKEDLLDKYEDAFREIHKILYPLPQTTRDTYKVAVDIFNLLFKLFKDLKLREAKEKGRSESSIGDTDYSLKSAMKTLSSLHDKIYDEVLYGNDSDSGKSISMSKMSDKLKGSGEGRLLEQLIVGEAQEGASKGSFIMSERGDKGIYEKDRNVVQKYVPAIRKLINAKDKNYEFVVQGCRSGLLDTTKLAEAYQGVPQVYVRKGEVKTSKTTVCVLVDESGSMCWRDKYRVARQATVLLNEALGGLKNVDLYIYGHSADQTYTGSTEIYAYREGNKISDPYALSRISARHENRDGKAIYETAMRVRKHTQDNCLMFVISDGAPAACGYSGESAWKDVRKNVKKVEKMGFSVIQVSIDHVYGVEEMFDHYISLEHDVANFSKTLGKVIKKAILDDKKTTII